eukprot:Hpha_TRINITY_DN16436_c0_g11::TRINITY_DN16436_c0_g11_i1::g.164107::m.164107
MARALRVAALAVAALQVAALSSADCDPHASPAGSCKCTGFFGKTCACIHGYVMEHRNPRPGVCREVQGKPPAKDARIVVIGAGPAGLHMATELKHRGYTNVEILEKTARVGGKSYTKWDADGVPHEMGTCYLHNEYPVIRDLIARYGATNYTVPDGRSIFTDLRNRAHEAVESETYVAATVGDKMAMAARVLKYNMLHRSVVGELEGAMIPRLDADSLAKINMTFGEWLDKHDLGAMRRFLYLGESAQGYGIVDLIPALYGLWWVTPAVTSGFLKQQLGVGLPSLSMLADGYSSLWDKMYATEKLNVTFRTHIQRVVRNSTAAPVVVSGTIGGTPFERHADFLIITSPLKLALDFLVDKTVMETEVFPALESFTLTTTLYKAPPMVNFTDASSRNSIAYWTDNLVPGRDGMVNCDRYSAAAVRPEKAQFNATQNRISYQFYTKAQTKPGNELPPFAVDEEILGSLKSQFQCYTKTDVDVIEQFPWPYFFHFDQSAINKGYLWDIMDAQGEKNTWYAGSSASFESVHDVTNYNLVLLKRLD